MKKIGNFIKNNVGFIALLAATVGVFSVFFITKVDGKSMTNTLKDGESVICTRLTSPEKGDIIVCDVMAKTKNGDVKHRLIKRVIATAGDTISVEKDKVIVNGEVLDEPYIREAMDYIPENSMEYPLTVPEGKYFVMGDNRNASTDSRDSRYGLISDENVIGKVLFH